MTGRTSAPALVFWAVFWAVLGGGAAAQIPSFDRSPLIVEADRGIEWHRDSNMYIALGNAKAVRGGVTVHGDKLMARYRPGVDGAASRIDYLEAFGAVRIVTSSETAFGDKAVYDVEQGVMILTGKALRLVTPNQTITARDRLEYWQERKLMVARGDAVAWEGERRLSADVMTAHLVDEAASGKTRMSKIDAFGKVRVSSVTEIATAAKGVYNLDTGIATLMENVKVTQGRNQLNGAYAEVNLATGVSRILSGAAAGRAGQRVQGLFVPEPSDSPPDRGPERRLTPGARRVEK